MMMMTRGPAASACSAPSSRVSDPTWLGFPTLRVRVSDPLVYLAQLRLKGSQRPCGECRPELLGPAPKTATNDSTNVTNGKGK